MRFSIDIVNSLDCELARSRIALFLDLKDIVKRRREGENEAVR